MFVQDHVSLRADIRSIRTDELAKGNNRSTYLCECDFVAASEERLGIAEQGLELLDHILYI